MTSFLERLAVSRRDLVADLDFAGRESDRLLRLWAGYTDDDGSKPRGFDAAVEEAHPKSPIPQQASAVIAPSRRRLAPSLVSPALESPPKKLAAGPVDGEDLPRLLRKQVNLRRHDVQNGSFSPKKPSGAFELAESNTSFTSTTSARDRFLERVVSESSNGNSPPAPLAASVVTRATAVMTEANTSSDAAAQTEIEPLRSLDTESRSTSMRTMTVSTSNPLQRRSSRALPSPAPHHSSSSSSDDTQPLGDPTEPTDAEIAHAMAAELRRELQRQSSAGVPLDVRRSGTVGEVSLRERMRSVERLIGADSRIAEDDSERRRRVALRDRVERAASQSHPRRTSSVARSTTNHNADCPRCAMHHKVGESCQPVFLARTLAHEHPPPIAVAAMKAAAKRAAPLAKREDADRVRLTATPRDAHTDPHRGVAAGDGNRELLSDSVKKRRAAAALRAIRQERHAALHPGEEARRRILQQRDERLRRLQQERARHKQTTLLPSATNSSEPSAILFLSPERQQGVESCMSEDGDEVVMASMFENGSPVYRIRL